MVRYFTSILFLVSYLIAKAAIIDPTNMIPWVPDVTVGVRGGIPASRTNIIYANIAPYNADKTGAASAAAAINAAISAATSGQVVLLSNGVYDITSVITINKSSVSLRGQGTNTILVGSIVVGHDENLNSGIFTATNGMALGSTRMILNSNIDGLGTPIAIGSSFRISSVITGNPIFQYISMYGADSYASSNGILNQVILVTNTSGHTIDFVPPLVWNFTNSPKLLPSFEIGVLPMISGVGIENLTLTTSNGIIDSNPSFMLKMSMCHDSWVTNCSLTWGANYNVFFEFNTMCTFAHNTVRYSKGSGSNHSGLVLANDSGCLFEDNIFADGLQPGVEFNDGFSGNVLFANFFTNCLAYDIGAHNTHPVFNLIEANYSSFVFELDGYFGSASHMTFFRNRQLGTTVLKRWNTYINSVGNVLGSTNSNFEYFETLTHFGIYQIGYPNIGNSSYDGTVGPAYWNYPGDHLSGAHAEDITNGTHYITSTQLNTNKINGVFTNIPEANFGQYYFMGQDAVNTNEYHFIGIPFSYPTPSNITLFSPVTVSNGWRIYITMQNAYQFIQTSNILTDTLTGNAVYTNQESPAKLVWNANGVQAMPNSYLYTNGAPAWWGAFRWPAIDVNSSPMETAIPAQARYSGILDTNVYVAITAVNCTVNGSIGSVSVPTNSVATVATNAFNFLNYSITGGSLSNANAAVTFLTASNAMTVTGNYSAPTPPAGNVTTVGRIYF